jgi:hypothetical protein
MKESRFSFILFGMKTLPEKRSHNDFGGHWTHVTDPAQITEILTPLGIPLNYNQLLVAKDPNGAFYSVYGAGNPHHRKRGFFDGPVRDEPAEATAPVPNEPVEATPHIPAGPLEDRPEYVKIYDRGDYPANFEK